jgi:hypothetical protein
MLSDINADMSSLFCTKAMESAKKIQRWQLFRLLIRSDIFEPRRQKRIEPEGREGVITAWQDRRGDRFARSKPRAPGRRDSPTEQAQGHPAWSGGGAQQSQYRIKALGDLPAALKAIQRSLHIEETENVKLFFVGCLRNLTFIPDGIDLRDDLARAMSLVGAVISGDHSPKPCYDWKSSDAPPRHTAVLGSWRRFRIFDFAHCN